VKKVNGSGITLSSKEHYLTISKGQNINKKKAKTIPQGNFLRNAQLSKHITTSALMRMER